LVLFFKKEQSSLAIHGPDAQGATLAFSAKGAIYSA
jgi:4'-phosphopantetheinyl transferase EntD